MRFEEVLQESFKRLNLKYSGSRPVYKINDGEFSQGFGGTTVSTPVTTGILGVTAGVPYGTVLVIPFLYYLAIKDRKNISWKDLGKIVVLCAPGMLIGNILFYRISPTTAKVGIGAMISFIALMNLYKNIIKPRYTTTGDEEVIDTMGRKIFRYGCLLLGGIVHGAFNIGGALITVYTLEAVQDKKKFRNTMTSLWCILNVWNAINQGRNGAFTPYLMSAMAVGLPFAAAGFFIGMRFLDKINKDQFLRIVYLLLLFIGGNMLVQNMTWNSATLGGAAVIIAGGAVALFANINSMKKANQAKLQSS